MITSRSSIRRPLPNKKPVLIGIYSPAPRQGSDTAAIHLVDFVGLFRNPNVKTAIRPFTMPMKLATCSFLESLGLIPDDATRSIFEDTAQKVPGYTFTGRDALRWIEEMGREQIDPDVWVTRTMSLADNDIAQGQSVVIDDVRRESEYAAIRARGGYIVKVCRTVEKAATKTDLDGRLDDHEFDAVFANAGTLKKPDRQILDFVKGLP